MDSEIRRLIRDFMATNDFYLWRSLLSQVEREVITLTTLFEAGIDPELLATSFWTVSQTISDPQETYQIEKNLFELGTTYCNLCKRPCTASDKTSHFDHQISRVKNFTTRFQYVPTYHWWAGSFVPILPRTYDPSLIEGRNVIDAYTLNHSTQLEIAEMRTSPFPRMFAQIRIYLNRDWDHPPVHQVVFGGNDDTQYEKIFEARSAVIAMEDLENFIRNLPPTIEPDWLFSRGFS